MAAAKESRSLEETPTWAVAIVCFFLLLISIVIENVIHLIAKWLKKRHKRALYEALEKIKSELMLLGFISLLLTIGQGTISDICISKASGATWHPCSKKQKSESNKDEEESSGSDSNHQRRLLTFQGFDGSDERRVLAAGGYDDKCAAKACRAKMRKWKAWEVETKTVDYQFSHGKTIVKVCFFRQFIRSVPKVDYLTLRYGFIIAHLAPQSQMKFDFQKYIKRSLEEDFKVVVGINPISWLFAVLFLMFNTHGSYSYLYLPFIPLIIILLVGTKLQVVITEMGLKIQERGEVVMGTPVVQPGNDHFWFNRPHLLLYLIHFVLFQIMFGVKSCYHEKLEDVIIRISMGIVTQILCSYVTLPLYALVTQMGSSMKHTIFNERVANGLRNWHQKAKKHIKQNRHPGKMVITPLSIRPETPPETPRSMSPLPLLHKHRHRGEEVDSSQTTPRRSSFEGWEINKDFTLQQKQRGDNQTDDNSNHSHNELQLIIEPYEFSFDQRANR
ncbi:Mlo-related protein [Corchorus olitorius]|uniref:MLO-like protein n=1 Tax=Corchorus olitorius TaxID=93759 RepID=A0A1R3HTF9_9ROSI|nr:Mlo-related protein [Corchorus olitorius]